MVSQLRCSGFENIVVISSLSAWMGVGAHEMERMGGFQPSAAYQACKAGIEGLAKHLAVLGTASKVELRE